MVWQPIMQPNNKWMNGYLIFSINFNFCGRALAGLSNLSRPPVENKRIDTNFLFIFNGIGSRFSSIQSLLWTKP